MIRRINRPANGFLKQDKASCGVARQTAERIVVAVAGDDI